MATTSTPRRPATRACGQPLFSPPSTTKRSHSTIERSPSTIERPEKKPRFSPEKGEEDEKGDEKEGEKNGEEVEEVKMKFIGFSPLKRKKKEKKRNGPKGEEVNVFEPFVHPSLLDNASLVPPSLSSSSVAVDGASGEEMKDWPEQEGKGEEEGNRAKEEANVEEDAEMAVVWYDSGFIEATAREIEGGIELPPSTKVQTLEQLPEKPTAEIARQSPSRETKSVLFAPLPFENNVCTGRDDVEEKKSDRKSIQNLQSKSPKINRVNFDIPNDPLFHAFFGYQQRLVSDEVKPMAPSINSLEQPSSPHFSSQPSPKRIKFSLPRLWSLSTLMPVLLALTAATLLWIITQTELIQYLLKPAAIFCPSSSRIVNPSSSSLKDKYGEDTEYPCIPCPKYGHCDERGVLECGTNYISRDNTCVPGRELAQSAYKLKKVATKILQTHAGLFECGYVPFRYLFVDDLFKHTLMQQWYEDWRSQQLKQHLQMPQDNLTSLTNDMKKLVLQSLEEDVSDITTGKIEDNVNFSATSSSKPFSCELRNLAWHFKWQFMILLALALIAAVIYWRIRMYLWRRTQTAQLYSNIICHLKANAPHPNAIDNIRSEFWRFGDEAVWKQVVKDLARDTRLAPSQEKVGDDVVARNCWRWVAPFPRAEMRREADHHIPSSNLPMSSKPATLDSKPISNFALLLHKYRGL